LNRQEKRQRGRPRLYRENGEAGTVQSLDRAVRLLQLVAHGNGLSLTEIAAAAGLAPSTVYRMLTTLHGHGMVEFEETRQLWFIGVETFRIGSAFLHRHKLLEIGRTVMHDLMACCGETANLAVAEETCVVFVSQIETHEPIRAFFRPGTRSPLHASGIGKAVLAARPPERVEELLRAGHLRRFTPKTLVAPDALLADLASIRERGWSIDDEESNLGMRCVAAAIHGVHGEPIGGISVSGPTVRLTAERAAEFGPRVLDAAETITRAIGGVRPAPSAPMAGRR